MKIKKGSKCPICEIGILYLIKEDTKFTYQGHSITFNDCEIFRCDVCGEGVFPDGVDAVIEDTLTSYRKSLHENLGVTPPK